MFRLRRMPGERTACGEFRRAAQYTPVAGTFQHCVCVPEFRDRRRDRRMARSGTTRRPPPPPTEPTVLPLEPGDHLTRDEFERRYDAMPDLKKAELIEGVVYMPSPVRFNQHAGPHFDLVTWL